jgi:hypothetical protein
MLDGAQRMAPVAILMACSGTAANQIGCILLSGLFFYDVFWVFLSKPLIGSNVMVRASRLPVVAT